VIRDNVIVDCATCREAVSARIDGETEPAPATQTDGHLRTCPECRAWQARAVELSRELRVREVAAVPDLRDSIMEYAPRLDDTRGWWPRALLGGIAVAQIGLALSQMVGAGTADDHLQHGAPVANHFFNESTAWNLALGIGLFWAAFRPRATSGLLPVLAGFVVVLLGYSMHDLITGTAPVLRVVGHGLLVVALCLLIVVNRRAREPAPGGADALGADTTAEAGESGESAVQPATSDGAKPRSPLRPAGRHHAA
jgi:predicted anti-sigma-YlaC factor YlaD